MKTRFFSPDQTQTASFLYFDFYKNNRIGLNYLNKKLTDETASIIGIESQLKPFENTDVELEFALRQNASIDNKAYRIRLNGRQEKISYFANLIHADPQFLGFYNNINFSSAGFGLSLIPKLRFIASLGRDKSGTFIDGVNLLRRNDFYQFGFNYHFKRSTVFTFLWRTTEQQDQNSQPNQREKERSLRFGFSQNMIFLHFDGSAEIGIKRFFPSGDKNLFQRFSASVNLRASSNLLFNGYVNYDNDETKLREKRRDVAFGLNSLLRLGDRTSFRLHFQTSSLFEKDFIFPETDLEKALRRDRDLFEVRLSQELFFRNKLSLVGRHIRYRNSDRFNDSSFLLEYSVPIGLPVSRKIVGGSIKGYVYDAETKTAMERVILRLNEHTTVTDDKGNFEFLAVAPGEYFLSVDKAGIPLNSVTVQKTPMVLNIVNDEKIWVDLGIARAARITGQIQGYRFATNGHTSEKKVDELGDAYVVGVGEKSMTSFYGVNQNLVEDEPIANIVLELTNKTETRRRVSDRKGRFDFTELPPGNWTLKLYEGDLPEFQYFEKDTIAFELSAGDEEHVLLKVLPKKRRIRMLQDGGVLLAIETNGTSESKTNGPATKDKPEPRPEKQPTVDEQLAEQTNGHFKYYTVQPGDWLSKIARRFYGYPMKYMKIFEANGDIIEDPDLIYPGQKLRIPIPATEEDVYTVQPGDWLSKIAQKYYGDALQYKKIAASNLDLIKDPNLIYPGQKLRIPKLP